ncbi:alkylphosphonate ABC transporter substrate-binidng protein [Metamycoplasma subdolum]|uniref:ABC transporter thiamine pyrophosphate-binding lipoprotein p37/Cypl n=1 Tax=Metamycoplasma subdolum TaxID=92407 RepID=UPI00298D14FC|nr:alkylphosphonate ABC transporter substrate-binidng protein [Metamycoplasma subdolum]WPB50447.1 alkylphosphonate ABC transporter substrate-binidng protein [Metamycoplasma subdolum]
MKFKKFLLFVPVTFALPLTAISCQKNEMSFAVTSPWDQNFDTSFFEKVVQEYNLILKKDNIKTKVYFEGEKNDIVSKILKGTSDVAFLTASQFNHESNKNEVIPILQTLTRRFNFDNTFTTYKDGSLNDPLRKLAKEAQTLFEEKPFAEWDDKSYGWNGSIYEKFYDSGPNPLTDYYRGVVMIWGNDSTRNAIKKAWDDKDWNSFRNFGIVTNEITSSSKYLLEEALFAKHFNKENNKFTSFALDKQNHSDKYIQNKARNISKGALENYHIVFDELGAFAYTHNIKMGQKLDYYSTCKKEDKIEFLTATEPIKYNIIAVSKQMSERERKALAQAFVNAWKNGDDNYGPRVGYNGYKIINDYKAEVIDPFENIFKGK